MNRIEFQKVLFRFGYNTYEDKELGAEQLKARKKLPSFLSIYLRNGYVIHLKAEYLPSMVFYDSLAQVTTTQNGTERTIVFNPDEVATIQVRPTGFVEA